MNTQRGLDLLGTLIGTTAYVRKRLLEKAAECKLLLGTVDCTPGAQVKFHLYALLLVFVLYSISSNLFFFQSLFHTPPHLSFANCRHHVSMIMMFCFQRLLVVSRGCRSALAADQIQRSQFYSFDPERPCNIHSQPSRHRKATHT